MVIVINKDFFTTLYFHIISHRQSSIDDTGIDILTSMLRSCCVWSMRVFDFLAIVDVLCPVPVVLVKL